MALLDKSLCCPWDKNVNLQILKALVEAILAVLRQCIVIQILVMEATDPVAVRLASSASENKIFCPSIF